MEVSSGSPAHAFTVRSLEFQKHGTSARYWNNLKPPDNSPPTWYFIITFYIVARYQKQFETINLEKNYKLNELEIKMKFLNSFSRKFIFRFWFLKAIYSSKLSHRERVKSIFKSFVLPITILPKNIIFYSQQIRKFKIKIGIFNNLKSSHAIIIFPNAKIILQFWFLETNILLWYKKNYFDLFIHSWKRIKSLIERVIYILKIRAFIIFLLHHFFRFVKIYSERY